MKQAMFLLCVALLAASCATTPDVPSRIAEVYRPLDNGALIANGAVEITKSQLIEAPGYKGCAIQAVNNTDAVIVLDAKVRWYERDGSEARKGWQGWRRITLAPGQPVNFSSIAPVPWCTEYGLEIKSSE